MRKYALLLLLILVLAIPLLVLFQDVVRDVILFEAMRLYWRARARLDSVPQARLWGLLLAVVVAVALLSLARLRLRVRRRALLPGRDGPVEELARLIDNAQDEAYFTWNLVQHLNSLVCDVVAHRERITPAQARRRLRAGELDLPPPVEAYLRQPHFSHLAGLQERWRRRPPLKPALEDIVEFLEEQMEVAHE